MTATATHLHDPIQSSREQVAHTLAGRVVESTDDGLLIDVGNTRGLARQAASCLVRPAAHDDVLVAGLDDGRWYVLAILERADESFTALDLQGNASIATGDGSLRLSGQEGVEVCSPREVSISANRFALKATGASLLLDSLDYLGRRVSADVGNIRCRVGTLETSAKRISQWAKHVQRTVEGTEWLRAGQIDFGASKNLRMKAKNALVTALSLVKVDGDQVHIG